MKALIFDTETINTRDVDCFDIALVLRDLEKNKIIESLNFFPEEVIKNPKFKTAYYYDKNREFYDGNEFPIKPMKYIRKEFNRLMKEYKPEIVGAFILNFDLRVINHNFIKYAGKKKHSTYSDFNRVTNALDIPMLFGLMKLSTNEYREYCFDRNMITKGNRAKTTAEAVYRFLSKKDFEEDHTALSDTLIESEILQILYNEDKEKFKELLPEARDLTAKNKKLWFIPGMKL